MWLFKVLRSYATALPEGPRHQCDVPARWSLADELRLELRTVDQAVGSILSRSPEDEETGEAESLCEPVRISVSS